VTSRSFLAVLLTCMLALLVVSAASSQETSTGNPDLDAAADYLRNHDIDALVGIVQMTPRGCVSREEIGAPPTCVPGTAEGTSVDTFLVGQCEVAYLTDSGAVRQLFVDAMGSGASSVYAVVETISLVPEDDGFWIVVTQGSEPSASAHSTVWHLNRSAKLVLCSDVRQRRGAARCGVISSGASCWARNGVAGTPLLRQQQPRPNEVAARHPAERAGLCGSGRSGGGLRLARRPRAARCRSLTLAIRKRWSR
jgi:hypothetical protein